MGTYKLSRAAEADLNRIWLYGFERYGQQQADRYYHALFDRFEEIANNPYLYQAVDHIREGYRRSACGVDAIYYRVNGEVVEIINILGKQDLI